MEFRVLIVGGRHFTDYPTLRATLDALLANRLPNVELLTTGGHGVPMLAASYAKERGLEVVALVPDFRRFPVDAGERRDAFLVSVADAALIVWDGRNPEVWLVLASIERKGIPVHVIGGEERRPRPSVCSPPPLIPAPAARTHFIGSRVAFPRRARISLPYLFRQVTRPSGRDPTVEKP